MKQLILFYFLLLIVGCKTSAIKIDRLVFHTSICYGTCPVYHLEVDGQKNIKLFAEKVYNQKKQFEFNLDTPKMGYFIGKLPEKDFQEISDELNKIKFDTLVSDSVLCCDGSQKTIILYSGGKRKEIKTMFEPKLLEPLINKLYQICSNHKFKRSDKSFLIEYSAKPKELSPPN